MADVQFYTQPKKPSVFNPQEEADIKRRRKMAEAMRKASEQPQGTEVVTGVAVKQSPLAALARAIQGGVAGYQEGQADKAESDILTKRQQMMADAIKAYGENPAEAAQMLGQDPNTSEMAFKIMMGEKEHARAMELARLKDSLSGGGNAPAPIQILQEAEKRAQSGDIRGANMLLQIAKVYDKGINPFSENQPPQGLGLPSGQSPQGGNGYAEDVPNAFSGLPMGEMPQMPQLSPSTQPPPLPPMSFQPITGYGDAVGSIAAIKKGMEQDASNKSDLTYSPQIKQADAQAAEVGKRLGEAQGTLTFLEANMPKLEQVTQKLSNLGKTATYTTAGRVKDTTLRELGLPVGQGAVNRTDYIATVDNEVLPLLRDTFGAAFTVKEGESLRSTLGDANKSPEEKDAVLRAFIEQKKSQVQSLKRQVGVPTQSPNDPIQSEIDALERELGLR